MHCARIPVRVRRPAETTTAPVHKNSVYKDKVESQCFAGDFFQPPLLGCTAGLHVGKDSCNLALNASFTGCRSFRDTQIQQPGLLPVGKLVMAERYLSGWFS